MSNKSYITVFGKWTVRGWRAELAFALFANALLLVGIVIGYVLWGAA
ncbi:hypothetical protein [Sinorhizobium meliloti]|nr:hypothetical protein [Sinorhizobium meliloti]MCO5962342.1 hypothetical protein [Sinorhizobium meliloti]MDE3791707.1 hypothetical protein [Sinorhizobium meliloti]MDE4595289.1 hypothetical protein [Sinorhizobium meliloti]